MKPIYVTVKFDAGVSNYCQARSLLDFEKNLRKLTGLDVRVYKDKMGDDSKLRVRMTPEERNRL